MIGYYVHHQGAGHQHRAAALARALDEPVVGISSAPRPADWPGEWLHLDRDDEGGTALDPTAAGRLHWVPLGDAGLRRRTARVARWLDAARPRLLVADVSVEIALLARLHGVPVVTVVVPGCRGDAAHRLGFDVSAELVGLWPPEAAGMLRDVPAEVAGRVRALGGLSRFPVRRPRPRRPGPPRVAYLAGTGGRVDDALDAARAQTPGWEWSVLSRQHGSWVADPRAVVEDADVVVTHAGQNALAEVAAARRPAVVVPQPRPHDEQVTTADVLAAGPWPALVEPVFPAQGWERRLAEAAALDGEAWAPWCDGAAAHRFAALLQGTR
ncbi:glycosyltransferase [Nocardioides pantholopis]|uniref:glycosyltransferase n=1 Tax=Nocardioides pantholopis TaxID=2483798 RepID=UPI000F084294|nr:glycosyltransferase [Nocardioides pantholopis]